TCSFLYNNYILYLKPNGRSHSYICMPLPPYCNRVIHNIFRNCNTMQTCITNMAATYSAFVSSGYKGELVQITSLSRVLPSEACIDWSKSCFSICLKSDAVQFNIRFIKPPQPQRMLILFYYL